MAPIMKIDITNLIEPIAQDRNYQENIWDGKEAHPNPESKEEFTKRIILEILESVIERYELKTGEENLRKVAKEAAKQKIVGIQIV